MQYRGRLGKNRSLDAFVNHLAQRKTAKIDLMIQADMTKNTTHHCVGLFAYAVKKVEMKLFTRKN